VFGGRPDATEADPDAVQRAFDREEGRRAMFRVMQEDQDGGQGTGHWREYLRLMFHRATQPSGYRFADLSRITAPTLISVGDRDMFCSIEEGVAAYRALAQGELAVLPATGHVITPGAVRTAIDFLRKVP